MKRNEGTEGSGVCDTNGFSGGENGELFGFGQRTGGDGYSAARSRLPVFVLTSSLISVMQDEPE